MALFIIIEWVRDVIFFVFCLASQYSYTHRAICIKGWNDSGSFPIKCGLYRFVSGIEYTSILKPSPTALSPLRDWIFPNGSSKFQSTSSPECHGTNARIRSFCFFNSIPSLSYNRVILSGPWSAIFFFQVPNWTNSADESLIDFPFSSVLSLFRCLHINKQCIIDIVLCLTLFQFLTLSTTLIQKTQKWVKQFFCKFLYGNVTIGF